MLKWLKRLVVRVLVHIETSLVDGDDMEECKGIAGKTPAAKVAAERKMSEDEQKALAEAKPKKTRRSVSLYLADEILYVLDEYRGQFQQKVGRGLAIEMLLRQTFAEELKKKESA